MQLCTEMYLQSHRDDLLVEYLLMTE